MKLRIIGTAVLICAFATCFSRASTIQVNGMCEQGTCGSPDVLALGSTISTPFDFTFTFANSDSYRLQGQSGGINTPAEFDLTLSDFVVTYLGNSSGTSSQTDVLDNDFTQSYAFRTGGRGTETVSLFGTFGAGLGSASSASAYGTDRGVNRISLGPVFPPPDDFFSTATINTNTAAGMPVFDYHFILTFGAGSTEGSYITVYPTPMASPVPEPSTFTLVASAAVGLLELGRRRSRLRWR